jgi:biotin transport system permease protein
VVTVLTYRPGTTVVHQLDPRSKLLFQGGFAVAVFTHDSLAALTGLTALALAALWLAALSPVRILRSFRFILLLLAIAPPIAALSVGPPWFVTAQALKAAVAGYQVVVMLLVAGAYVRTTSVRKTRAAIQRHVPGRAGQLVGVGVGLVFRLTPVLVADIRRIRDAIDARSGQNRSTIDRVRRLALVGIRRAFTRASRLSLALRARCFAWNPTLPPLSFSWIDVPVIMASVGLVLSVFL